MADRRLGYTLIEALIAMIMFTFISLAAGAAFTAALHTLGSAQSKSDQMQEARGVMSIVARDVRNSYASAGNPYALFMASGDNNNTTTLYFTTRSIPTLADVPTNQASNPMNQQLGAAPQNGTDAVTVPQADVSLVAYTFDPSTHSLYRWNTSVPNPQLISQQETPENLISNRVLEFQMMFQDPANPDPQNGWESVWSYEANPTALGMSNTSTQSNTTLPMSVQINVAMLNPDNKIDKYSTTVPIFTPQPQAQGQTPPTTTTGGGSPAGSSGNGNKNGNGSGGTNGGKTGGTTTPTTPTMPATGGKP